MISITIFPFAGIAWITASSAKYPLSVVLLVAVINCVVEYRKADKYKLGPVMYDSERELYCVHIGDKRDNTLLYSCWGMTEAQARRSATILLKLLNK